MADVAAASVRYSALQKIMGIKTLYYWKLLVPFRTRIGVRPPAIACLTSAHLTTVQLTEYSMLSIWFLAENHYIMLGNAANKYQHLGRK